jgi:lipoprotein-anchoring transpeptidase ErfK/SrfK
MAIWVDRLGAVPRRRWLPIAAVLAAIILLLAVAAYFYDHSRRDVIAKGVKVDGVPVGGLHAAAARKKVESVVAVRLNRPVTVRFGTRSWKLAAADAKVRVDVSNMISQAISASREGSIFTRVTRELFGGSVKRNVAPVVRYSHHAVRTLAKSVRASLNRPPQDATVQPSGEGLRRVPGHDGLAVNYRALGARISESLVGSRRSRLVPVPVHHTKPAVTTAQLASKYPAYIVIDRASFRLRFYGHLKLTRSYEIAVGMEGLETPAGLHHIEWKQVNPPWYVPNKAWAGALAGTVVPPGPADPLKARFMSFEGGAGIHGIDPSEYSSIGHDASHGCVRMRIPDVIDLYSKTPVGTPVYIV